MNVQFIECIATPAFGDLYVFISLCPQRFFLSLLKISVTKREKNSRGVSQERKANKERKTKTKQKKQHKIPNTKNVTYSEKDNNQRKRKNNNTET